MGSGYGSDKASSKFECLSCRTLVGLQNGYVRFRNCSSSASRLHWRGLTVFGWFGDVRVKSTCSSRAIIAKIWSAFVGLCSSGAYCVDLVAASGISFRHMVRGSRAVLRTIGECWINIGSLIIRLD